MMAHTLRMRLFSKCLKKPREEGAEDEHRHQHQPEDRFGFVIIPYVSNPFTHFLIYLFFATIIQVT